MISVFSTYHPAALLRDPSKGHAVEAHLRLLSDYLDGKPAAVLIPDVPPVCVSPPGGRVDVLSLDIETYGILAGRVQTQFHPRKSFEYDGVPYEEMVRTVGLSWGEGGEIRNTVFVMQNPEHRAVLWKWLRKLQREGGTLLGQNLPFDLMYLRACYPECRAWLAPPLRLADLSVTNYLHSEVRPERSLKALAPLLGVTQYDTDRKNHKQYLSDEDPELWRYNCQDTAATLMCQRKLEEAIAGYYGSGSAKLSEFNRQWYSELLWLVIWMSESGVCMSRSRLEDLLARYESRRTKLVEFAKSKWAMPLRGEGSEKAKREAMNMGLDAIEGVPPDLELTEKTQKISFSERNRNTLLDRLDRRCDAAMRLRVIRDYSNVSKMLDSYLYPLIVGRGSDHDDPTPRMIDGIVYPRWFPVPSQFDDGAEGGTRQSRIVCKGPAVQTFPQLLKDRIVSRFPGGSVLWIDYSQIELRVAALLSGDPVMLAEYLTDVDRHTETTKLIFGDDIVKHPQFKSLYRQAGKTLNFLVLYRGGAVKFQETLMADVGLHLPIELCQSAITAFWSKYPRLIEWQDGLIREASRTGRVTLPLTGQSRLFLGGRVGVQSQINEVVNMPVQAVAANICLSGQFALTDTLRTRRMSSIVSLNVYDAVVVECPRHEVEGVKAIAAEVLPSPRYYSALCDHLGRRVPLAYEVKQKQ